MATETMTAPAATTKLHAEPTTLYYYLEVKDGGIIQTYPGTAFEKRRKHVPHDVTIRDLRPIKDEFTIDRNGFQLVPAPALKEEHLNEEDIQRVYYPQCEELFKKVTGCDRVHFVSHMTRRHRFDEAQSDAAQKDDKEFVTKNNPARFVHVDQSYRGAEQFLYLNYPEEEADRVMQKRWAIMNVWQPIINPVERDPLAFCDFQSIEEKDFRSVVANLPPPGAGEYGNVSKNFKHKPRAEYSSNGEQGAVYEVANKAHNPNEKWYYADKMTPEEAWVFKIFDSSTDGRAKCAVHSSFPLSTQKDEGTPRQSIELRAFLFWDN